MHDIVIRGGSIVDGTGAPPRSGDVAIDGDRIVGVGEVDETGRREIDATGAIVTPGFVDVHAHYDGQATWDERMTPSSWHGVTTVVMGNCGVGFAPVRTNDHNALIELMEGVEDIPGAALHEGISWEWESFADYLDALDGHTRDIDICALVPHGAVRLYVMGARGAAREAATAEEIAEMGRVVRHGVEAGAFGFSTSRTLNHRTSTGSPTPTLGAAADELVGIVSEMRRSGRGAFEVVSDFDDVDDEFDAFHRVASETGARTFISMNQNKGGGWRTVLDRFDAAVQQGAPMTLQVAVRPIGVLFALDGTLNPFLRNPVWRAIEHSDRATRLAALRDRDFRARLVEAADEGNGRPEGRIFGPYDRVFPLGDEPDYEPDASKSIGSMAARAGLHPVELMCDLLAADDGTGILYYPLFNFDDGHLEAQRELLEHPNSIIGLADGGAHVGTICDASFPTTLLTHWVRDRPATFGPRVDLEWAVHALTGSTAAAYGLDDRGVLAPGLRADVNVIDLDNLRAGRPELHADLPAGGRRFLQRPAGYLHTLVAGQVTYVDGEPTDALPGRLVRSGR